MNESVILDFLISNSCGDTLYFDSNLYSTELLKEAILRGFQVCNFFYSNKRVSLGDGVSTGRGEFSTLDEPFILDVFQYGWGISIGQGEGCMSLAGNYGGELVTCKWAEVSQLKGVPHLS